jgi:hypothetical protein
MGRNGKELETAKEVTGKRYFTFRPGFSFAVIPVQQNGPKVNAARAVDGGYLSP